MGGINSILKKFSCNCASDCHINSEVKEFKKFLKRLAEDDIRELMIYFEKRKEILNSKRAEIMEQALQNVVFI